MMIRCATKINNFADEVMEIDMDEYERLCKSKSLYEQIPDDQPVSLYADFDLKKKHLMEGVKLFDCTMPFIDIAKRGITDAILELGGITPPRFAHKTATKIDNTNPKLSFHIIVTNYKMTKIQQCELFKSVNKFINTYRDDKWADDYLEMTSDRRNDGFFDLSVYSKGRKMRSPFSTKEGEDRPFLITEGTFRDCIISMPADDATLLQIAMPEKKTTTVSAVTVTRDIDVEKLKDYLSIIPFHFWNNYNEWYKGQRACANLNMPFEIHDQFMRQCTGYDYENNLRVYQMPPDDKNGRLGWKYIYDAAYKTNPKAKLELDKKWREVEANTIMTVADIQDAFKSAEMITPSIKQSMIMCKEKWYVLNERNLWTEQKDPSFYVVREIRKCLDYSNLKNAEKIANTDDETEKDKLLKIAAEYIKCYKLISGASYLSVVTKFLKTHLRDDSFAEKLDTNCDYLAFENGIIDLKTGMLREGIQSSDFISSTIPDTYKPADQNKIAYLKSVLLKILNNNREHLEYFLSLIGYSFIGRPNLEKSLYFCVDKTVEGKGDNGKSLFFEIITELFPNYVYKCKSTLLEESNTKVHKQLAQMKGKRLVWLDEYGKNKTNAELMKIIGDGTTCENEVMFGTTEIIRIFFKLFALTNHIPNIDPNETAVYNRYKQISYGSHFDRTGNRSKEDPTNLLFIADPEMKNKILTEYRNEVYALIIEYAGLYYKRKMPRIPDQFLNDTKETQNTNDDFSDWVNENLEEDPDGKVALKQIMYVSGKTEKKVKEGMKRLGWKYDKDLCGLGKDMNGKFFKGGYVGIRFTEEFLDT